MAKNYAQLQTYLTFDELMRFLDDQFRLLPDHRSGNAVRYPLADVLKSAFAMFSLKSPSLLDFKNQTVSQEMNLRNLYRIQGAIPCDNQMRGILDPIDPNHLRQITGYDWSYILNVKPDSRPSLERQFAGRQARGQVKERWQSDARGAQHYFAWMNDLCLCESAVAVKVNYLLYEQTDKQGQVKRWTWMTNLRLNARSVERVMRAGRSRWKIENETFNTLKNQGYHFEHNYGHGPQHLASVLALLMLLAFTVDQIQQHCCRLFRLLWKGLGTNTKLWSSMRHLFNVLVFESMEALYRHMASLYRLQIE